MSDTTKQDKSLRHRANLYAERATHDLHTSTTLHPEVYVAVKESIARAFVLGFAAGCEDEAKMRRRR